jgi:hypothetical protein
VVQGAAILDISPRSVPSAENSETWTFPRATFDAKNAIGKTLGFEHANLEMRISEVFDSAGLDNTLPS